MKTNTQVAIEWAEKFSDTPSKTLGRAMYKKNKLRFSSEGAAYSAVRKVRGNNGQRNRKYADASVKRENQKAGWVPNCPPSLAEPWIPFELPSPSRVLSLSDTHIPFHDQNAVEAAVKYAKKNLDPTVLLINGDLADFYNVSRWVRDPNKRDFKTELELVKECLSWLRGQFPKAEFIYKQGNHEQRWDHFIWNKCVEIYNLENLQLHNILEFEKYGITRVDDQPVMAGNLPILHGHELGRSVFNPVNPARGAYLRTHHNILVAHNHRTSAHAESDMFGHQITCWSQGCLCDLTPEYSRINSWNLGFAEIEVASDKSFNVSNFAVSRESKTVRRS